MKPFFDYFHLSNMRDFGFTLKESWLDRCAARHFCESCGLRLSKCGTISIQITARNIPPKIGLGAFGLWDIGFIHHALIDGLNGLMQEHFRFGKVRNLAGTMIPDWFTFCSKGSRVPIRSHAPLTADRCPDCGRISFAALPVKNRYVVTRKPLTLPLYESNEAQLIIRADIYARIENVVPRTIQVEKLDFRTEALDGRAEPELEWGG